jgi:hypothetical protein
MKHVLLRMSPNRQFDLTDHGSEIHKVTTNVGRLLSARVDKVPPIRRIAEAGEHRDCGTESFQSINCGFKAGMVRRSHLSERTRPTDAPNLPEATLAFFRDCHQTPFVAPQRFLGALLGPDK